ncbi:hypothetical protein C7M84_004715 [Penaeus vannamei]|uniref:Uncharacterized protein n=1 Tax=Penaeus vannamei TaxID=6689 RepID=A0A423TJN7_PENVA|nr:hypothetical protein C7M84_004715 [Penaeus vannamei]
MATPQEDHFQAGNDDLVMVVMTAASQTSLRVVRPMYHHPSHPLSPLTLPAPRSTVQLLSMIAPKPLQVQQTSPEQQAPAAHQLSPVPPVATTSGSPHAPITMIPSPPQLQSDVTYQLFRQWRRKFEDYSVLMGLHSLPPATQHIYLRTCVSLEVQRLLHYTLAIPPDSSMPVVQVLDALQQYFRNSQNEALRRRELLSCKQTPGEPFSAFYARMKDLADEVETAQGTALPPTQHPLFIQEEPTPPEDDSYDKHTPQRCQSPPLTKDSPPPVGLVPVNMPWDIAQQKIVPAQIVGTRVIGTVRPGAQQRTLNAPLATNRVTSPSAASPPGRPLPTRLVEHVECPPAGPLSQCNLSPRLRLTSSTRVIHTLHVLVSKTDLQTTPLKKMSGPPMRIHLQPGIISPVGDKPSEWCHPMVLVPKPGNGVRITVDLTRLNSQVSRPTHPSPTPADAIRTITPSAKFFTKADALHGYWQMDLAEEDRHLTTFITPHGRYYHCRGPMGFAATGDAYCLRGDLALQGITNCVKVVDDILLFDSDLPTHLRRVFQMLSRCRAHGITLNKDKFMVAATNRASLQTLKKVAAIRDYPTPSNITDLRSFMGLVNQLADFSPEIAATAQPLRPLMSPKRSFTWTPDHDQAFEVKAALLSPPVLAPFNPKLPVTLKLTPLASMVWDTPYFQEHGHGQLRLVQCGSRFLTDAESRYATIELEMLAASWAMGKCRLYLAGLQHFTLHTTTGH